MTECSLGNFKCHKKFLFLPPVFGNWVSVLLLVWHVLGVSVKACGFQDRQLIYCCPGYINQMYLHSNCCD